MTYYLDTNAHCPKIDSSIYINKIKEQNLGNPFSINKKGRDAAKIIEHARDKIAELLNVDGSCIYFCHGGTEANYWALTCLANYYLTKEIDGLDYPTLNISPYEHSSVDNCLTILPFEKRVIELNSDGSIAKIENSDYSIFVGVQNEIGTIADFKKIRENTKSIFFSDLSQAVGKIKLDLKELDIDIATFSSHKFGGPSGVGILYLKKPEYWTPLYAAKSYNRDIPGSLSAELITDCAYCMEKCVENSFRDAAKFNSFQDALEDGLEKIGFEIVGKAGKRINTTTLAKVPDRLGMELLFELEIDDIIVSLGSACGSMEKQPLKSAIALGYKDALNSDFIRISHNGQYDDINIILFLIEKALTIARA